MLTKPQYGWTDFGLEGTCMYGLSYLDDIAFDWVGQAIHGLETMLPFCVKGFLEPGRLLCTVSYWNCYIVVEDEERHPLKPENVHVAYSHTSMLEFCKCLHSDVSASIDEWVSFMDYRTDGLVEKKKRLVQDLAKLSRLISEREELFGNDRCFL